jgi:hypothetical protein
MALPPTYSARVTTSAAPRAERRVSRGGLGDGLTLLGREGSAAMARRLEAEQQIEESEARIREREIARDRQQAALDIASRFTRQQVTFAERQRELEQQPQPGGAGHEQAVAEALSEQRAAFFAALPDDEELVGRARREWAEFEARALIRADAFEAAQRVEKQGNDFTAMAENSNNLIHADPTVDTWQAQGQAEEAFIDAMEIGEDDKANIRRERAAGRSGALLTGMIDSGRHAEAEALLASGAFDDVLTMEQKDRFGRLAGNARETAEREAELAVERQRDALQEEVDLIDAQIAAGATDVGAGTLASLAQRMQDLGFAPADVFEVQNWSIRQEVNKRYGDVGTLNSGIRALESRARAGTLDVGGQIQLEHMRDRRATLLDEKGEAFKDEWAKGGRARSGVVTQLYTMPVEDRVQAASALDKSGSLGRALRLSRGMAQVAVAGAEARGADKELVPGDRTAQAEQRRIFDQVTSGALTGYSVRAQADVLDLARDIYAGTMQHYGKRDFDEARFREAVQAALGRNNGLGGVASWNGEGVLLPEWLGWQEFGRKVRAFDFANAAEPAATVLRKYTPVLVEDGPDEAIYAFRDDTGAWLGRKGGGEFRARLRKAR